MPTRDEHLAKADQNEVFLTSVVAAQSSAEWAIVVLFYRAVHLVEAWFALRRIHNRSHQQRTRAVNANLAEVSADYAEILKASRTARYDPAGLVTWEDYEHLAAGLTRIEAFVRADLR